MTAAPVALITGINGQDGTYLAERLLAMGWQVSGTVQPGSARNKLYAGLSGIEEIEMDLASEEACTSVISSVEPDHLFHFAGISSVAQSWSEPVRTARVNGIATVALLTECLALQERTGRPVRVVNASSAEIFAGAANSPQSERTPLAPLSPYGTSKAFGHTSVQVFRGRGLHAGNAIFFNHESPLRSTSFVTRKISSGVAAIAHGTETRLRLGNLDAIRDWGWAPDYVDCVLRMALHPDPDDYVVATGERHSVREFVGTAFRAAGIDDWQHLVETDPAFERPADGAELVGDADKARQVLDWCPTKGFDDVVAALVEHDLAEVRIGGGVRR